MKTFTKIPTLFALLLCGVLMSLPTLAQQSAIITTYAGGTFPVNGAQATTQNVDLPGAVVSDRAGGFYFKSGYRVYRVSADGALTIVAGDGWPGFDGDGGPATAARFLFQTGDYGEPVPGCGLAVDAGGNLYIADVANHRIRKVTPAGIVSTVAGNGSSGFGGDGGPATAARLASPNGITVDAAGNLFIADSGNWLIRKVTPAGIISTVAGGGSGGVNFTGDGGPATAAQVRYPVGVAVDNAGNLYIGDHGNYRIRKVNPAGIISTVAGNGTYGFSGDGGPAISAQIYSDGYIAVDAAGTLFIADNYNSRIRKVTPAGIITTVAGAGVYGFGGDGGPAASALFGGIAGISVDAAGNMFIADTYNDRIRKIAPDGIISTVAGKGNHFGGDGGLAIFAQLYAPSGVAADRAGNVFFSDASNHQIRRISPLGIITTVAGVGTAGFSGDGGLATAAGINRPTGLTFDAAGNLYFADTRNNRIRRITPAGIISTVAGSGAGGFGGDGGSATSAALNSPWGLAFDAAGNLIFSDSNNYRIRKVTPAGIISTIAGSNTIGSSGDGGPATSAGLGYPQGVAVDTLGNVFIVEMNASRIRKVTPDGNITTVAGTFYGYSGDDGPAIFAQLAFPQGIALDPAGNLFIADSGNHRIRKITPDGIISTVAGNGIDGFNGDGGPPASAQLNQPGAVAVSAGALFIADTSNDRIRRVRVALTVPVLTSLSRDVGDPGATFNLTLSGTSFSYPFTVDSGSGIAISGISVISDTLATATLSVASNASLGLRNFSVTTALGSSGPIPFNVVPPFPDLSVTSSQSGNFGVGANGFFVVDIVNVGRSTTSGAITVKDVLPPGLTFVSGSGSGWSCSASEQTVTCANPQPLASGSSTELTLTVAVSANTASHVIHTPEVTAGGDLNSSNNITADTTTVATLDPLLQFASTPVAGRQTSLSLTVPIAFPMDVTGILALSFLADAAISTDDPAIQFVTGGRTVAFTIPANTREARFGANMSAISVGFQTGTVAGALSFSAMLTVGSAQKESSITQVIPKAAPVIQSSLPDTQDGFAILISSMSTVREVSALTLQFNTTAPVKLSCGSVPGCTASGATLTFDVKPLFDGWYSAHTSLGSLTSLRLPLSIQGAVKGTVRVTLRNSLGASNTMSVALP